MKTLSRCLAQYRWIAIGCLLVLLASLPAYAASDAPYSPPAAVAEAMQRMSSQGVRVERYFAGPLGWTGVSVSMPPSKGDERRTAIWYVDAGGQYLMSGLLLDLKTMSNVVEADAAKYLPEQSQQATKAGFPATEIHWIEQKPSDNDEWLYVFIDPTCPHCREQFGELSRAQAAGEKLPGIRWVPISLGNPVASTLAARILGSPDPLSELAHVMEAESVPSVAQLKQDLTQPQQRQYLAQGVQRFDANLGIMQRLKITSTPTIYYISHSRVAHVWRGLHSSLDIYSKLR